MEQAEALTQGITPPQIDVRSLTPPTRRAERLAVLWVFVTVAVALLLGWALMSAVTSQTAEYNDGQIAFKYPARWVVAQDDDGNAMVRNPASPSPLFSDRVVVVHAPAPSGGLPAASPLAEAATAWTLRRSQSLDSFRNLATEDGLTVAGQPAMRVEYVYVADPAAELGRPGVPVVVRGSDYILLTGDDMTVLAGQAADASWEGFAPALARIVNEVRLEPATP
jgi:hypothetical protein